METVLLLKAVLPLEEMAWDPVRRTAIRPEGRLRPNPFDLRALGAALAVRRPGETVTVLSVGPEAALPALAEALRAGADRAIRIGDPALAGSDLLITARVLARALGRLPADLILAGRTAWDTPLANGISLGNALAFILGLPALVLGVWELHQNKMAARELLWQYRHQLDHFARARERLARTNVPAHRRRVLARLGKDSLMESYLWTIHRYHREHEPGRG